MQDIDNEWESFISNKFEDNEDEDECTQNADTQNKEIISSNIFNEINENMSENMSEDMIKFIPKVSDIYISTTTKISYLNTFINLKEVFWKIPIIPYAQPSNGIVKKQIKFNSVDIEELTSIQERLKDELYFEEFIITSINNPTGRIKFKDIRKISIGISKKDIMSYRCKKKSAFYNCFVLIFRIKFKEIFKEIHVKVFNTGKLEIPGIQNEEIFKLILDMILVTLQPHVETILEYKKNSNETVLINSNFNCGFYINREKLFDILKFKYNIQAMYDPCSYPGIQCKFYYNPNIDITLQTGSQISEENKLLYPNIIIVSFMIFRTGSILIVGKCDENVLIIIYNYLKQLLITEYSLICQQNIKINEISVKDKKKKIRKKIITLTI